MQVKGHDLRLFLAAWSDLLPDWYTEDGDVDSDDDVVVEADYCIEDAVGAAVWQGYGPAPTSVVVAGVEVDVYDGLLDVAAAFVAWRALRGGRLVMLVEIPAGDVDELQDVAQRRGWALLGVSKGGANPIGEAERLRAKETEG